ncbi:MAG: hypothetical protein A2315_01945 [Ignavibacteria bacterium RIFOXYB2_FULL_35_12]|nr:MAG: hypothetical protein A2058_01230 [Ignavibacteria bacterium GWA2_36_19]OGU49462.1 MAG: hypothetical protein A2006_11110 [Ignavibacteria bacterium GWC2_35_8]OGU62098.1 MAG: hypothetical protein A2X60_00345 [Ignavibacteria bacterium GWF2_35_20]OGU79761.1 MAG: hypothetical protein A2254_02450 [Ignavibacteria bacterium RIFOXYA2_FULL_35_9]OGU80771.1 MAG: hypothetical protein A2W11_07540 [Ignavibacteria bacterium RBG_16_35_7]OGU84074.1 MAG: hypothetical protein A3K31_10835 [Ignavibacteria bac
MQINFLKIKPFNIFIIVLIFFIIALIFLLVFIILFQFLPVKNQKQPIAYNHKVHIETAGLQCIDCHVSVEQRAFATLPSIEICQNCHSSDPLTESEEEKKLLTYISEGKEIPWIKIYNIPDHVYFSHRRHVIRGEISCSECHGNINEMTSPVSAQFKMMSMNNCMKCHKERKVTTDCLACHR